jgi:5-methylthioadenosine/S-adenosylhomocysteine deaminase
MRNTNSLPDAKMHSGDFAVRATWILTVRGGDTKNCIHDGVVVVRDGMIISVSSFSESSLDPNMPLVHLEHHAIIPGLINCHTHSGMSLLRGYADELSLDTWLKEAIWPVEAEFINEEYIDVATRLAIYEMLKTGTTTFTDMYFLPEVGARVAESVGIRMACGEPIIDFHDGRLHSKIESAVDRVYHFMNNHDPNFIIPILNPHACYTVPEDGLKAVSVRARNSHNRVHLHLHETQHECDNYADCHFGKTALETLIDVDLLNSNLIAAHCVCLSDDEINLLAQHRVNVVHCPKSNMKLASGICPVQRLIDAGVNVALGTDSACSNNSLNMISEMQAAALVGKSAGDPTAVNSHTVLRMATWNGAVALGLESKIGSIEIGKLADFISIDLTDPSCQPVFDPVSAIVYSTGTNVSNVWISGKRLVENGTVVAQNLNLDMNRVHAIAKELTLFKSKREASRLLAKKFSS